MLSGVAGFSVVDRSTRQRIASVRVVLLRASIKETSVATEQPSPPKQQYTARFVAAHALLGEKKGQPSLQRLEMDPNFTYLQDQRDRSFARLLVTTVERRRGQIDKVLQQCQISKKKARIRRDDLYVEACLRIGAAQLLFLDVPPYAVLKETIDILRLDSKIKVP